MYKRRNINRRDKLMIYNEYQKKNIKDVARSGRRILQELIDSICPNITTTGDIELMARKLVNMSAAKSSFFGYSTLSPDGKPVMPYPCYTCISINEEVVHGIPSMERIIKPGDLVTIELGINRDRYHADLATTVWVAKKETHPLIEAANEAFEAAVEVCKDGCPIREIAIAIETVALRRDLFVVDALTGHGVGRRLHEEPIVPNSTRVPCEGELKCGTILTIEPMFCEGSNEIEMHPNRITVLTKTRKPSVHVEHMLYITKEGCEILS